MRSIQFRVAVWLAVSLSLVFITLAFVMRDFPRYLTEEYVLTRLQHDAESLSHRLMFDDTGQLVISPGPLAPIYAIPESGHYFQAMTAGVASLKSPSLQGIALNVQWDRPQKSVVQRSHDGKGNPLLVWLTDYPVANHTVRLAVAEDVTHMEQHLSSLQRHYGLGALLILVLILTLQALVLNWSLKPLERVRSALSKLSRGEAEAIDTDVPSEIHPLVSEINHLGHVVEKQLARSRTAIGNLAHALKTPLAAVQQLLADPAVCDAVTRADVQAQLDKVNQSIDRELRRARLSGTGSRGQRFDPREDVNGLVTVLEKVYPDRVFTTLFEGASEQPVNLDRADMMELLGNVLDNACKWATKNVLLQWHQGQNDIQIIIEDDGPGVPSERLPILADRGARLDESRPGHGLGLAIVAEIVQDYGGAVEPGHGETLPGFRLQISLPWRPMH